MADYKIKSNLNLYGNSINNFAIQADSGFPASPIMGRTQFYTGGGEYANHIVVYDGKSWKAVAYTDDVKNNADFINLKARVDAFLDGGVNSNDVLDNLREIQQFLDTYGDTTKLVDLLGEINEDIAEQADRISDLESKATQVSVSQTITAGKEIGKVTIDGNTTKLYAPANYNWNEIEGTPRTLDGYGILDGVMYKGVSGANASGASWMGYTYNTTEHGGAVAGGVIQAGGENNAFQLNGGYEGKALYYRGKNSGVFTDWKQVAFTDGRVAGFRIIPYASNMDANTALANGGIVSNYNMSSNGIVNAPSGMTYGSIIEFAGGFGTDYSSLAGQLAWDINHNSKDDTTRRLWWRANDETKFANAKWHQIAFMDAVLPLSGGTMTGQLIISSADWASQLVLDGNKVQSGVQFKKSGSSLGFLLVNESKQLLWQPSTTAYKVYHEGNIADATAGAATKLADNTAFTAWGQTFFENGKPKNVSGSFKLGNATIYGGNDVSLIDFDSGANLFVGYGVRKVGNTHLVGNEVTLRYGGSPTIGLYLNSSGNVTIGSSDKAGADAKLYVDGQIKTLVHWGADLGVGDISTTENHWNGSKSSLLLCNNNNALSVLVSAKQNERKAIIQVGHSSTTYADSLGSLHLNPFGGNVLIGTNTDNGSGAKLQVNGSASVNGSLGIQNNSGLYFKNTAGDGVLAAYVSSVNKLIFGAGAKEKGYKTEIYGGDIDISSSTEISLIAGGSEAMTINTYGDVKANNPFYAKSAIYASSNLIMGSGSEGMYFNKSAINWHNASNNYVSQLITFAQSSLSFHQSAIFDDTATINGKLYANAGADITGDVYVDGNVHITGNLFAEKELGGGGVGTPATGGGTGGGSAASGLFAVKRISEGVQSITLNHGLDTRNLVICIYEKDENALTEQWNMCLTDVEIISEMEIRVSFGSATTTEHKVVIMGAA